MVDDFLGVLALGACFDVQCVEGFAGEHTSLEVEVSAGALGVDGDKGGLDGDGHVVDKGYDALECEFFEVDILA